MTAKRRSSKKRRGSGSSAMVATAGGACVLAAAGYGAYYFYASRTVHLAKASPAMVAAPAAPAEPITAAPPRAVKAAMTVSPTPTARPPAPKAKSKMTAADWRDLDDNLAREIRKCWTAPDTDNSTTQAPRLKVEFDTNGRLSGQPVVLNLANNPAAKALAESARAALGRCADFTVPARFQPYHDEWKTRVLHFDGAL